LKLSSLSSRRLTIAKELYLHGHFHSIKKSLSDVILAILNFDFCAETIIKAVLFDANVKLTRPSGRGGGFKTFDELISDLRSLHPNLKFLDEVSALHKLRNDVQHQSVIPSEHEVSRHEINVRLFFEEVCKDVYDGALSFDHISLTLFIRSEIGKFVLAEMEKAFQNSKYSDSVYYAKQALIYHIMLLRFNMGAPHTDPFFHSPFSSSDLHDLRDVGRFLEQTNECLNWIIDRLCLQDYYDEITHLLGSKRTSSIYWFRSHHLKREEVDQNGAEQVKNLVYEFITATQDAIKESDLDSPFIYDSIIIEGESENEYVVQIGFISVPSVTEAKLEIKEQNKILDIPLQNGLHKIVIRNLEKGKRYVLFVHVKNEKGKDDHSFLEFRLD